MILRLHSTVMCPDEEVSHSERSYCCVMTYGGSPQEPGTSIRERKVVMMKTF